MSEMSDLTQEELRLKIICPDCGAGGEETHQKMFVGTEWVIRLHEEDGKVVGGQCKRCYNEHTIEEFLPDK